MNRISEQGHREWLRVKCLEEVYEWHRRHTPWWSDEFLKKELLPRYIKMETGEEEICPLELSDFEKKRLLSY
jgi:hypothetical protein